jgi:hypothetical protein
MDFQFFRCSRQSHLRQHPHRLVHRIDDGACDALVDDFRNGTTAEGKDGIQSSQSSLRDSRSSRSMLISCHGVDARPISFLPCTLVRPSSPSNVEHFLDQNGLHPRVQSLAVLGVETQPACGFRRTLPSAILHALVMTV